MSDEESQGVRIERRQALVSGGLAALGAALGTAYWLRDRPAEALASDRERSAHLLRRAGFAPSAAEVDRVMKEGLAAATDRLLHPERESDKAIDLRLSGDGLNLNSAAELRHWWLVRMAGTRRPLLEKTVLFWHGLLTSSYRKTGKANDLMYVQNQFLRDHALGSFRDLLVGITRDGAMLRWLDGTGSTRAHPNENYGRELMELFTLGPGNYTETDVREASRALTGYVVDKDDRVAFRQAAHDAGPKTFLGKTGNFGVEEIVDTILATEAAPRHLATKLWEYFAFPDPTASDLKPVVAAFHSSGGNIRAMLRAIFESPTFYSTRAYRGTIKSPTELSIGLARQFGLSIDVNAASQGEAMGQALLDPPNVAGWSGGPGWMTTGTWIARMRFIGYQVHQNSATLEAYFRAARAFDPEAVADLAIRVMVDDGLTPATRAAIRAHADEVARTAPGSAALAREVVYLVAATPEYQLA